VPAARGRAPGAAALPIDGESAAEHQLQARHCGDKPGNPVASYVATHNCATQAGQQRWRKIADHQDAFGDMRVEGGKAGQYREQRGMQWRAYRAGQHEHGEPERGQDEKRPSWDGQAA